MSKKPDLVAVNPGLSPYPTNVGAPAFTVPAVLTRRRERGANARAQLTAKFEELKQEYFRLAKLTEDTEMVYNAICNINPVVGQTYHLYNGNRGVFLSIIEPERWKMNYLGSYKLTSEHTWLNIEF